jgi:tetratricopeptide (TPR) repeat protein
MPNAGRLPSAEHAKLLFEQALNMHQRGRLHDAEDRYRTLLRAYPEHPDCNHFLGVLRFQQGRNDEALKHISAALKLQPSNTAALANYALVLVTMGRLEQALASYDKALAIEPDYVDALVNRGNILVELKRFDEALASYDKALAIKPDYVDLLKNRAIVLVKLNRLDEALASYDKALAIKPDYVEALANRGSVLTMLKRHDEALASYDRALKIRPGHPDALIDRGWLALLQGRYAEGWRDYESRREVKKLPALWPKWKGEDLREKRIIVYEEQGLGDVIQCCRFLTLLAARGAQVTFLVRASLHRLLRPFERAVRVVDKPPTAEIFDFQSALMSLPGGLDTTLENIPADIPYLYPEEPLVARWRERLGSQGFKVGICWQGKPDYKDEPGRSIPLRSFQPLARVPGVRLISLQKHHGLDQLENLPPDMRVEALGQDFDNGPDAFVDTAAMMSCLDLIITSDTSIAHLAGALGRPVWVTLKHVPHWLWMLDRTDSPWYPTMTLYRQEVRDDWTTVFRAITDDLAKLRELERGTIGHVLIPGSVGELFDRMTILTIKAKHIKDPDRLHNVNHELGLLRSVEATCGSLGPEVLQLVSELQSINERLWAVEDELRACERRQAFGEEFIRLARAVYKTNDQRAAVKKRINILCGSQIIDEKSYVSRP